MFLLKLALRPWRQAPLSQMFTAFAVGLLLLLIGFLFWMERGLRPVLVRLQNEQVVTAYLDPSMEKKDEARIVDTIRTSVGAHAEVRMVDTRGFLGELKEHYPELSRELEDLGTEMNSIIPRYVTIAGMLGPNAGDQIKAVPGIEGVDSSKDRYQHIVGAFSALRWVAKLLIIGLCVALFTGLIHLAKMNSQLHQEAIALMRLWGAGAFSLRAPALLSGLWVGLLGGGVACVGWIVAGRWLGLQIRTLSPMLGEMPQPSPFLGAALLGAGILIGALAGTIGESRGGEARRA